MREKKKPPKSPHSAPPASDKPRRIAMLIYPGVAPLDVAGPLQVFGVANFLPLGASGNRT